MRKAFYIERIQSLNCEALQHLHVESEILYFETGHGVLQIHDSALPVRGYQMCIIPPATPHSLKLTGNNVLYRCLVPFVPQDAPINRLVDDIAFLEMRNIFATMYRLFNQKDMVHPVALFYHFIRALCELAQERRAPQEAYPVHNMLDILHTGYTRRDFTVREVFATLPLSENYLRVAFKEATGYTPQEYLIDLRIRHACSLLIATGKREMNVKEIALQCGFSDPLYFSRIFHKHLGIAPSEYRASFRKALPHPPENFS